MVKVARAFPDAEIVATLSHQLTWSHFIELAEVSDPTKRPFYQQISILYHWIVRQLRVQRIRGTLLAIRGLKLEVVRDTHELNSIKTIVFGYVSCRTS